MAESYIFGYGSPILPESRERTGSTGQAIPALVIGLERGWMHPEPSMRLTALGATYTGLGTESCNGFIFSVHGTLRELDTSHVGSTRIAIPHDKITPIGGPLPSGAVWVYSIAKPRHPTETLPIAQSYIDAVLSWAVQNLGEDFARAVIQSTYGWQGPWLNDRENPRYPRHIDYSSPDAQAAVITIDALLETEVPSAFAFSRRIQHNG